MNKIQKAEQARELAMSLPSCHEKAADASRLALALSKISGAGREPTLTSHDGRKMNPAPHPFYTPEAWERLAAKRQLERTK